MTTLTGTSSGDTLTGTAGDDIILGLGGNDSLSGGDGADYIEGGSAGDTLTGNAGADVFAYVDRRFGDDVITDFTAGDKINLAALYVGDFSQLQPFMKQQGLNVVISLGHTSNSETITLNGVTLANLTAASFMLNTSTANVTVSGSSGSDVLFGGLGADQLYGLGGNDTLSAGAGADYLEGAAGDDILTGGAGADTFSYVERRFGDDVITDFTAGDKINLAALYIGDFSQLQPFMKQVGPNVVIALGHTSNSETITINNVSLAALTATSFVFNPSTALLSLSGSSGNDVLFGGLGVDQLSGQDGNDTLSAGSGSDYLVGGRGDDTLIGGADADVFGYIDRRFGDDVIVDFTAGDKIDLAALNIGEFSQLQPFMTQNGLNVVIALGHTSNSETITINGVTLSALTAADFILRNSSANVTVNGTSGGDVLFGGLGNDQLYGAGSGDVLSGGAGTDYLDGGASDDVLIGGGGGDTLVGGTGSDSFYYMAATDSAPTAYDIITDFQTGADVVDLKGVTPTEVSLVRSGASTFVFVNAPGGQMTIAANGDVNGSDVLTHDGHGIYMIGDGASNTLIGGVTGDVIQAGDGNDVIIGGGGGDVLFGQAGADTFKYLAVTDSNANGSDGLFVFETGVDKIDLSVVHPREVSLIRSGGSTFLFASTSNGAMQLATVGYDLNGRDIITGDGHGFYMIGDSTADTLIGGSTGDVIQAGGGNDTVIGGGGGDAIWGGAGADVFKYLAATDSNSAGTDTIFDFQSGVDKIDLTAVRTGASDVYGVAISGGSTFIFVDLGGNGVGDMTIQLNGVAGLQNGDILF